MSISSSGSLNSLTGELTKSHSSHYNSISCRKFAGELRSMSAQKSSSSLNGAFSDCSKSINSNSGKKTPKGKGDTPDRQSWRQGLRQQLESVQLELDVTKHNMTAEVDLEESRLTQIEKDRFLDAINHFTSDLSSKLNVVKQLSMVEKDLPTVVIDEEALCKSSKVLEDVKIVLDNLTDSI